MRIGLPIPPDWAVESDEIAPYIFKIRAVHISGPSVEFTGSDSDDLEAKTVAAVLDIEEQLRTKAILLTETP
jgi:hypothetical protein